MKHSARTNENSIETALARFHVSTHSVDRLLVGCICFVRPFSSQLRRTFARMWQEREKSSSAEMVISKESLLFVRSFVSHSSAAQLMRVEKRAPR